MQGSLVPGQRQIDNLHRSREVDINVLLDLDWAKGKVFVGRDIFWERRVGPYIPIILLAKLVHPQFLEILVRQDWSSVLLISSFKSPRSLTRRDFVSGRH